MSEYPLQKKRHTLEFLRGIAHLRPRTNTIGKKLESEHVEGMFCVGGQLERKILLLRVFLLFSNVSTEQTGQLNFGD